MAKLITTIFATDENGNTLTYGPGTPHDEIDAFVLADLYGNPLLFDEDLIEPEPEDDEPTVAVDVEPVADAPVADTPADTKADEAPVVVEDKPKRTRRTTAQKAADEAKAAESDTKE